MNINNINDIINVCVMCINDSNIIISNNDNDIINDNY